MLLLSGLVMLKIGKGIHMNGQVLSKAAALIGDTDIPPVSKWWKSVSSWITVILVFLGLVLIGIGFCWCNI